MVQPYNFQAPSCITVAEGFKKLRVLEVVLSCRLDIYFADPRPVWESQMKEHAITVLGNTQGHAKALKIGTVDILSRWDDIRDIETQIIAIP